MGCGHSQEAKTNDEINKMLHDEKLKSDPQSVIKLLLLGNFFN